MAAPASFPRRVAAYALDLAAVAIVAVPLVAWTLQGTGADVGAGIDAIRQRMWDIAGEALLTADPGTLVATFADDPALHDLAEALVHTLLDAATAATLTIAAIAGLWFVGFESSARQATPGKAALGLRVTDVAGARPSPARVLGRFVAGVPSWLLLNLGHLLAAVRDDGRALHDLLAGTRVEQADPAGTPLPAWARAWLAVLAMAAVVVPAWLVLRYVQLLGDVVAG